MLASARTQFPYNRMSSIKEIAAAFLFTFIFSNIVFIFFENPLNNLLNYYLGFRRRSQIVDSNVQSDKKTL